MWRERVTSCARPWVIRGSLSSLSLIAVAALGLLATTDNDNNKSNTHIGQRLTTVLKSLALRFSFFGVNTSICPETSVKWLGRVGYVFKNLVPTITRREGKAKYFLTRFRPEMATRKTMGRDQRCIFSSLTPIAAFHRRILHRDNNGGFRISVKRVHTLSEMALWRGDFRLASG